MPKVSVIIPVFNTEKYLRKCLDSVCNQTLSDIEIICVDDCSTDNSLNILKEYASKDNRIKLIEFKENKGAAVARNTGIIEAKGEYLGFIDSDDYIDQNFYENLYKKVEIRHSDIVKGSDMKLVFEDGRIETDEQNFKIKKNKINFWCQYTTAIYKRDFILKNKIDFPVGLLVGEDPVFTIKSAILSDSVEVINNAQYYYVRHEGSLNSNFWDENKIKSYCEYVNIVTDFAQKQNLNKTDSNLLFGRLLDDIEKTKESKVRTSKKAIAFDELFNKVRAKNFKYPIKLLFEMEQLVQAEFTPAARRGIYWVTYNLLQKFIQDDRFDVSLYLRGNFDKGNLDKDPMLKGLPWVYETFGNKLINNKHFLPYEYDVFFNPAIYKNLKEQRAPLAVNMLYDTIPVMDPKWYSKEGAMLFYYFYRQLTKYNLCFCDSQSCKDNFSRFFYNLNPENLHVSYVSTAQNFKPEYDVQKLQCVLNKYKIDKEKRQKYIFYLGSVDDTRKNTLFNIECFIKFIRKYNIKDLYFYLGGNGSKNLDNILKEKLGSLYENYKKYIVQFDYIEDEDINILYSNSLFFSFLSLYEGFGMPPLEAMQAGTPVVCANNSSLPEVVGDAGILVDAEDEEKIIEAFRVMYFDENKRNEYIQKGLERAKQFSWDKTYKLITDKIIDVLSGGAE